jgi:hypothetical protein
VEITIKGEPKEIAALVLAIQERQERAHISYGGNGAVGSVGIGGGGAWHDGCGGSGAQQTPE